MKIFINLPTWLGDAVMSSTAIYALFEKFPKAQIIFYGSFVSTELFKNIKNSKIIIEDKKHRYLNILKQRSLIGECDIAISFRSAFSSKIILNLIKSKRRFYFNKRQNESEHQVLKYLYFIEKSFNFKANSTQLKLPILPKYKCNITLKDNKKILALNPGAHYGSAKRWEANYFAKVAKEFAKTHKIVIFGVKSEEEICNSIENILKKDGIKVKNLCSKTSINSLCKNIAFCDLFISNDSGSMHIAAVYKVKTIAIFGSTNFNQTSPWQNENAKIVHLNLACMPCMQKTCPLKHHKCMKDLTPDIVIKEAKKLLNYSI